MAGKVVVDGDLSGLERKLKRLLKENERLTKSLGEQQREHNKNAQVAARAIREIQTPTERYEATLKDLKRALKANTITMDQFRRASDRAKQKLDEASRSNRMAFGAEAVASVASYATGLLSVTAALGSVKELMREVRQEQEALSAEQQQTSTDIGSLRQISASEDDFAAHLQTVDRLRQLGVQSKGEAVRLTFQLESAGMTKSAEFWGEQAAKKFSDTLPEDIKAVSKLREAFQSEGLSSERIADMALAAAEKTPEGRGTIAKAASIAGPATKRLGLDSADTVALTAQLSLTQSAEQASTQIKALALKVAESGVQVESLDDLIAVLQDRAGQRGGLHRFLGGSQEALLGAENVLRNPQALLELLGQVERSSGLTRQRLELGSGTLQGKQETLTLERRRAEFNRERQLERFGRQQTLVDTAKAEYEALLDSLGHGPYSRGINRMQRWLYSWGSASFEADMIAPDITRLDGRSSLTTDQQERVTVLREILEEIRQLNSARPANIPSPEAGVN